MANKQKSGGGARKIGRDKLKCKRYSDRLIRFTNKLKRFLKHNISKTATATEIDIKRKEFKTIQDNRKR